jgi:hypothetical protein
MRENKTMQRFYKVAVYADMLDTNPTITTYDTEWEAQDAAHDAIEHMTQWEVDHSPYAITEEERDQITERNSLLVKIFDGITFSKEEGKLS